MGDIVLRKAVADAGLQDQVRVDSCGIGGWHIGQKADRRALATLADAGYDGSGHRAAQLDDAHAQADLIIAMDRGHRRALVEYGVEPEKIHLLREFDPNATSEDVEDPYYGYPSDFVTVLEQIEAAIPGIMAWLQQRLEDMQA